MATSERSDSNVDVTRPLEAHLREQGQLFGGAEPAEHFANVAINRPMRCEFTYRIPPEMRAAVVPGVRVTVPFARGREVAVVVALATETDVPRSKIKNVAQVLDVEPVVTSDLLELTRWMASYYACSWGEALSAVLPAALKRTGGRRKVLMIAAAAGVGAEQLDVLADPNPKQHRLLRTLIEAQVPLAQGELLRRLNLSDSPAKTLVRNKLAVQTRIDADPDELATSSVERKRPAALTLEQASAIETMIQPLVAGEYTGFLLRGVTGSGKTEVYLRVIERALELGRGAIVLVPEIALTPQTVSWFRSRFGEVAVLHSRMTDSQRLDMWLRVKRGQARVVVGARSAVFAPVPDLGVIVVDEEHEPSFKQGNAPRYHGRDVAVMRARKCGAICILGSATPAIESWTNARNERYTLVELNKRVHGGALPAVEIVNMVQERAEDRGGHLFSRRLRERLRTAFEKKEQSILFLNRRGFSPVLWCKACGKTVRCPQCDVSMNFHRRIDRMVCHSCCDESRSPQACPTCTAPGLRFMGSGSERVEDALRIFLPDAKVARMDSDTMLRREDYEETLEAFGAGEIDVLVGTQMIAKGLDFPRVTVVGIISADAALHIPDFRAAERTFQLISQVSGRAGRGDLEGSIVVQTDSPDAPAILLAAQHDYEGFVTGECVSRKHSFWPPYARLVRVLFEDEDEERVDIAALRFAEVLSTHLSQYEGVVLLGPSPASISLLRGRHRKNILIKGPLEGPGIAHARSILTQLAAETSRPRVAIDVDPVGML